MPRARHASGGDAIKLLMADHKEVNARFEQYRKLQADDADDERQVLAQEICVMLTVHTRIEEELFYPAARDAIDEPDLVDEALVEHASAKELIAQIQDATPDDDPLYDAKVHVLAEYIKHHVKEEEGELFPKVKKTDLDLAALGAKMTEVKQALVAEMQSPEENALSE